MWRFRLLQSAFRVKPSISLAQSSRSKVLRSSLHSNAFQSIRRTFASGHGLSHQEVESRVMEVFQKFDRVNQEKLSLDAQFTSDLGLDSLDVVEVVIALEEQFHLEIPDNVADSISTPRQAVEYLYKMVNPPSEE